jgi:hypothetical protein
MAVCASQLSKQYIQNKKNFALASLSERNYYNPEDNLQIMSDLLTILFTPTMLFLVRYILIKKANA